MLTRIPGLSWPGGDPEEGKKKDGAVNAEINGREVDFKNISIEEALDILQVCLKPTRASDSGSGCQLSSTFCNLLPPIFFTSEC